MQFIGNYADIVKPEWIEFLTNNNGDLLPKGREYLCEDWDKAYPMWKPEFRAFWYKFEIHQLPFTIPWPVPLSEKIDWWIVKQLPGQCIPIHVDDNDPLYTTRYVLMLQDYVPGHMLMWNDNLIRDYKKGDMFKVTDVNSKHGSANISNDPRFIAHLTVWN